MCVACWLSVYVIGSRSAASCHELTQHNLQRAMSSLSYASRLTQGVDYGECGLAEKEDTARVRRREMDKLEKLFRNARYVVMHTGAGVSTGERCVCATRQGETQAT